MSSQKPKISFNAGPSPRPAPVVRQAKEEFVVQAEAVTETSQSVTYDGFDREEWERQLTAPEPTVEPVADLEIAPMPYEPFTPTPKSAGFSPIGFFKKSQPRFFDRRAASLGIAALAFGAVAFVGVAAILIGEDDTAGAQRATFSALAEAIADADVTTRAAIADMTMTTVPRDLPAGTALPSLKDAVAAALPMSAPAPVPEVLAEEKINKTLEILNANKLQMLRESVLAGIYSVETYEQAGVQRIRLSTQNTRLENQMSSSLRLEEIAANEMKLSKALYTTEGDVDAEIMMFNLVQASCLMIVPQPPKSQRLKCRARYSRRSPARSQTVNGLRYYAVQEGDSLAYIAL